MSKYKFFEKKGNSIVFTGDILNVYIPKNYFETNISYYNGNEVSTIGYFLFEVKTFAMEEKEELGRIYTLKLPTRITFEFDDKNSKTINLKNTGEISYEVLTMNRGSLFLKDVNVERSAASGKDFLNILHGGRFPSLVPYNEIIKLYNDALNINLLKLGCQNVIYEIMVAELIRNKKNTKEAFRKTINKGNNVGMYDYKNINMKNIAFFNSTYSAISFENFNKALITSTVKDINNEKEIVSPVEKVLKY